MKIWKIVTVLLAVLLLTGCVGSVSGAPVSTITITGIEAPDIDDEPDTSASANSGVTVNKVTWSPDHDTFDAGTSYTVKVTVKATEGFAEGVTATVNSKAAKISGLPDMIWFSTPAFSKARIILSDEVKYQSLSTLCA